MSDAGAQIFTTANVARVAETILEPIRQELATYPPAPARVLVVLNALAYAAGTVLAGTDFDPGAIKFFEKALEDCMREHEKAGGG